MTSLMFILSWFFVMQSMYHPNPMEYNLIPNSKHLSALDGSKYQMPKQNVESSFGNRKLVKHDGGKCHQNDELAIKVYMTIIRVQNSSEADIVYVPFFSSLSYNRYSKGKKNEKKNGNKIMQEKLVKHLTTQEQWKRSGGKDHLILAHHPNRDVHFSFGSIQKDGIKKATKGMRASKFCLNIAGDTPSSNRLFDAIASHCVPVIISDAIELPYEDVINYSEFCIFVRTVDAIKENFLINFIRGISREEWTRMWNMLKEIEHFFEFHFPSKENDVVPFIWQAVARKLPAIRLKLN
ncbi:hypothetical protein V8G54_012052 [Vigna mungo]|uniref:Exostosin GT47 domain-containing protein n=1 Tax=Vigna mungo TaxID=3915 RepID=A0AAQ3NQN4_VIGMU